jgi:hypothetical protein
MAKIRTRENVRILVEAYPHLAENKNELLAHYWFIYDNVSGIEKLGEATNAESIMRELRRLVGSSVIPLPQRTAALNTKRDARNIKRKFTHEFTSLV